MEGKTWIKGYCSMDMGVVALLQEANIELYWQNVKGERCAEGFYCPVSIAARLERVGGSPYYPAHLRLKA
jgi:hypothetical protein